jgi:hypothetical protein
MYRYYALGRAVSEDRRRSARLLLGPCPRERIRACQGGFSRRQG